MCFGTSGGVGWCGVLHDEVIPALKQEKKKSQIDGGEDRTLDSGASVQTVLGVIHLPRSDFRCPARFGGGTSSLRSFASPLGLTSTTVVLFLVKCFAGVQSTSAISLHVSLRKIKQNT